MADVNKTVDIQVKADMKQLLSEFKKMPGMTQKEAKKMVSQLSRELKAAEKAAKEAAKVNEQSMKKIGNAAKNSTKEIRKMKRSSQEMGGALQATGDIIGEIDPAMGGLVATLSIAGTAVRDLGKAFFTGNPYILAAVVLAGSAAAAYAYFSAETKALDDSQNNVISAINNANDAILQQEQQARNAASALTAHKNTLADLQFEYELLSGGVTQLDADMRRANKTVADQKKSLVEVAATQDATNRRAVDAQKRAIKNLKLNLQLMEEQGKKTKETGELTDGYAHKQRNLARFQEDLIKLEQRRIEDADKFAEAAAVQLVDTEETLKKTAELRAEQRKQQEQEKKYRAFQAQQAKEAAQRNRDELEQQREAKEFEQHNNNIMLQLIASSDEAKAKSHELDISNRRMSISAIEDEVTKIDERYKLEKELIEDKISSVEKEKAQNIALAETEEQRLLAKLANQELDNQIVEFKEQAHLKEMEQSKEREKALDNEKKKRRELISSIVSQTTEGANAVSSLIKNVSGENKKAAMIAFRVNQAAAISNIVMSTAEKIMQVAPNPFAMAGVSALGALQAGVVATQPPPEFHMGGVIDKGEDTRNITVLTGEAVLDRRTVQNLGGDAGIAALQRGEAPTAPEVIVMNPFKHFDRYAMASSKRGGVMKRFSNTRAAGGY